MQEKGTGKRGARLAAIVTCAGAVSAALCIGAAQAQAQKPAASKGAQAELDALVKAARTEGQVTFYSAPPEQVAARFAKAFTAKYGVQAQFVRISTGALMQRFSTEAGAGNFAADAQIVACCENYIDDGVKKGWMEPIASARIPAVMSGEFPARFVRGGGAVIQVEPWGIGYNTEKVKGADVPKDWRDVLAAKWRNEMILTDPNASDSFILFFSALIDKYGESYLAALRGQSKRSYGDGIQAAQGVAAGEGAFLIPTLGSVVEMTKAKGAPIAISVPDYTTGVEFQVIVTSLAKAKHPNAARLLTHYLMTPEGNKIWNESPGSAGVFDAQRMPKQYVAPNEKSRARKEQIVKLLGF